MVDWRKSKYLEFRPIAVPMQGRTKRWGVVSKSSGDVLGLIEWYGAWRQYIIEPREGCVFNNGCLNDISAFLTEANAEHKRSLSEAPATAQSAARWK